MEIAITLIFILYVMLVSWLMIGWKRVIQRVVLPNKTKPFISIVVPVRNEATTITNLLNDLAAQTYSHFEIIIVNDHSDDNTSMLISSASEKSLRLKNCIKLLSCTFQSGKKAALTLGIEHAKGEIIMTTDADCRLPVKWIETTIEQFSENINMVVGGVHITSNNFFSRLQQLEFASLIGSGGATLGWQKPTMANGANLAFRKQSFEQVKGYQDNSHIPSGDDEFLLRKFHQNFPNSIVFNSNPASVVSTSAQASVNNFFQQRFRWAGKWKLHKGCFSKMLAIGIFTFQSTFLLTPWLIVFKQINPVLGFVLLLVKAFIEFLFFKPVLRYLLVSFSWPAFLALQFIYPWYVVFVALVSNLPIGFGTGYQWKGRRY